MPRAGNAVTERRNFHVPLPRDVYAELQAEAARSKMPANALAREAILRGWPRDARSRSMRQWRRTPKRSPVLSTTSTMSWRQQGRNRWRIRIEARRGLLGKAHAT